MRRTRAWAVAGLVAAMTAGGAASAQASAGPCPQQGRPPKDTETERQHPSRSVSYRFRDISEAVLLVPVPVERVRHLVPSRYELLVPDGRARLVAAHGSVDALSVGCSDEAPATVSEYGVMLSVPPDGKPNPDGTPSRNAYYLSLLTDDRRLFSRMMMLGAPVEFARGRFDEQSNSTGGVQVSAEETWKDGAVELAMTTTEPAGTPKTASGVRFWFDGPRGTIRNAYECPDCRPRSGGTGSVFGSGSSAVEGILGGARVSGSGFFIRTTLLATAELVDLP